jgi:hypothetical protein
MSTIIAHAELSDITLAAECHYVLRKIYSLEDVRYELEKKLESINIELEEYNKYNSELIDETERRGWVD